MTTKEFVLRILVILVAGALVYLGVAQEQVLALLLGLAGILGLGGWSTVQEIKASREIKQLKLEVEDERNKHTN